MIGRPLSVVLAVLLCWAMPALILWPQWASQPGRRVLLVGAVLLTVGLSLLFDAVPRRGEP